MLTNYQFNLTYEGKTKLYHLVGWHISESHQRQLDVHFITSQLHEAFQRIALIMDAHHQLEGMYPIDPRD